MAMNNQGRPSQSGTADVAELPTISGDRGLDHEEKLIFELVHFSNHLPNRSGIGQSDTAQVLGSLNIRI